MENIINVNDNFNLLKFISKPSDILKIYRKASVLNAKYSILKGLKISDDDMDSLKHPDFDYNFDYKYFLPFATKGLLIPLDSNHPSNVLLKNKHCDRVVDTNICEELFLIVIVTELMNIIQNNYALNTELYDVFKYKYFLPILQSEYVRMKNEDINYAKEKPFIICFESALSRMLNDGGYISNILTNIITKLCKRMKKYKLNMFKMDNDKIGATYKGKFTKCLIPNLKTNKSIIKLGKTKFDFTSINKDFISIVEYFSKIIIINSIRKNSISDMNRSCNDDLIENINNELYIFNSRNAKVLSDYMDKFDDKFHVCKKFDIMNIINKTIKEIREKEIIDIGFNKFSETNNQSVVETTMVEIYSMISNIESMNRDYTINDGVFAIDINDLHNKYEKSKLHIKDIINLRDKIFDIMYKEDSIFNYDTKEKTDYVTLYEVVDTFFRLCVSLAFKSIRNKTYKLSRKTLIDSLKAILEEDSASSKDVKFVIQNLFDRIYSDNTAEVNEMYNSVMDNVYSIITQLEKVVNVLDTIFNKEIYSIINDWHSIMLKNIRYFQYFDPINEFGEFIKNTISSFDDISLYSFDLDIIVNKHSIYYK